MPPFESMTHRPRFLFLSLFFFAVLMPSGVVLAQVQTDPAAGPADEFRARLLASLANELVAHFNLEGELQLETTRPWTPVASPPAADKDAAVGVTLIEYPSALASSLLLRVRVTDGTQAPREETVICRAQLWRDAWVTQTPAARGSAFDPTQCDVRRIDALRERDTIPASFVNSTDWSFLRPVPAGRLLTWRDISRRALVRKGNVIDVTAMDGSLQVNLKALAMQDGGKGETVRVRNLESRREFAALVVAENRAQVRF